VNLIQRAGGLGRLGGYFRYAYQGSLTSVCERAQRGPSASRAQNNSLCDALANIVLCSEGGIFTYALESQGHIGESSRIEISIDHGKPLMTGLKRPAGAGTKSNGSDPDVNNPQCPPAFLRLEHSFSLKRHYDVADMATRRVPARNIRNY
jgi:hypothetical protein